MIGVYILQSGKDGTYYTGSTNDINRRLYEHNHKAGGQHSKFRAPWKLIWYKECVNVDEARKEEKRIKSFKGGNGFKKLIG